MRANTSAIGVSGATVRGWRSIARSKGDEQIGPLLGRPAGSDDLIAGDCRAESRKCCNCCCCCSMVDY